MNWRRMLFGGLTMTVVGLGLGLVLGKIVKSPYTSSVYQHVERIYIGVGGAGGFIFGWSGEGLRQLKARRDREES
ncbi:MAG: hypothetical protein EA368_03105 [Leptolyngbya sp. DLM2.Bin27]|nr:MAG: hypothetical protein EA368_03105 [Leptolyngbya sp. DLM2.Bin27]